MDWINKNTLNTDSNQDWNQIYQNLDVKMLVAFENNLAWL